jgi:hypothetical protein
MGGAFVAIADDASATVTNPAGLAQIQRLNVLSTIVHPYNLSDVEELFLSGGFTTRYGSFGLSWPRIALEDVTSEELFTLAYSHDLIRTSQDASLSIGGSLDILRVSYDHTYEAKTALTGSFGILLRPFPIIGLGYAIRNLGQPSFDWIAGDGATNVRTTQAFGLAYYYQRRLVFQFERELGQDREWRDRAGIEVYARRELRFRAGLNQGDVTGGIGVYVSGVGIDVGVSSHSALGLSYFLSIGYNLPSKSGGQDW